MASEIHDKEFGIIKIKKTASSRWARLKVSQFGEISITIPRFSSSRLGKNLLDESRISLRKILKEKISHKIWKSGDTIGTCHKLEFKIDETVVECRTSIKGDLAIVFYSSKIKTQEIQKTAKRLVRKILMKQARSYLPRRISTLANDFGFEYKKLRFSSAKTRWGSYSASGTLSLNIELMLLPLDLIDYVLIHELCHTRQLNHSRDFWREVEACMPDYKQKRKQIKQYSPGSI